jgi:hypothetical protein
MVVEMRQKYDFKTTLGRERPKGRFRKRIAGFSGMATLFIMLSLSTVLVVAVSQATMAINEVLLARRSQNTINALMLAESGVDDTLDQVRGSSSFTGSSSPVTIYSDAPTNHKIFGTYTSAYDATNSKITSIGVAPGGMTKQIVATISSPYYPIGDAAIRANSWVQVTGNANIATVPVNMHDANIYANSDISAGGSSSIDGQLVAHGTVSSGATPAGVAAPISGAALMTFPSVATTNSWKSTWYTQAHGTGATIINGSVSGGSNVVITAPAYISGNISLGSHSSVTINGTPNSVVYVAGNVSLGAQSSLTNSCLLVVMGTFSQVGQAQYQVSSRLVSGYTPTVVVFDQNNTGTAMSLLGGSGSNEQGVMYAVSGKISFAGNSTFTGALVAGGTNGAVYNTGDFTLNFPVNMKSPIQFQGNAVVTNVFEK